VCLAGTLSIRLFSNIGWSNRRAPFNYSGRKRSGRGCDIRSKPQPKSSPILLKVATGRNPRYRICVEWQRFQCALTSRLQPLCDPASQTASSRRTQLPTEEKLLALLAGSHLLRYSLIPPTGSSRSTCRCSIRHCSLVFRKSSACR
jgi:hypothetical protein